MKRDGPAPASSACYRLHGLTVGAGASRHDPQNVRGAEIDCLVAAPSKLQRPSGRPGRGDRFLALWPGLGASALTLADPLQYSRDLWFRS